MGHDVLPSAYTPESQARTDVRDFMKKISAREDPDLPIYTARAHVTLKDGRKITKECLYIKGHPKNPFTVDELKEKYRKCLPYSVYKLSDETAGAVLDSILNLENRDDIVKSLVEPLTPG
jgi:2-methylcitrate dehydratase PrpD